MDVEALNIKIRESRLVITWQLAGPVPDDIGSPPAWGDHLASWTVHFTGERVAGVKYYVEKLTSEPFHAGVEGWTSDREFNVPESTEDGPTVTMKDGNRLSASYPAETLDALVGQLIYEAESETICQFKDQESAIAAVSMVDEICD